MADVSFMERRSSLVEHCAGPRLSSWKPEVVPTEFQCTVWHEAIVTLDGLSKISAWHHLMAMAVSPLAQIIVKNSRFIP